MSRQFDVFLSYNSLDTAIVERIAQRLKEAGLEPWLDKWSLTPGGEWQRELGDGLDASVACAVFVGPHALGGWEGQELAVALGRAVRQPSFRVFPVLLPGVEDPFDPSCLPHFLRARTWVDYRRGHDDGRALQDLINAVRGRPFGADVRVSRNDGVAPYRGLRVFREEDAPFFFGRDGDVQRMLEKLKSSRFVAVVGPSGSGKSSLVRAGLVPELRAGSLAQVEHWDVALLRPGAAPLTALAAQLAKLLPGRSMQATLDKLTQDPRTLHLSIELALADRPPGERVLVVVDQLEEVFTLCPDERERRQLFSTLLYATWVPGGRTVVIVTMRSDFYGRCVEFPELAQAIAAQQLLVCPMDASGLRQAIEAPAGRVDLKLENRLSETILADVAAEPGALPLLEHSLLELWDRRSGNMLTLAGYHETGGVHGSLAKRAEDIFNQMTPGQQEIARRTLLRLVAPGEGTDDTRSRETRRELASAEGDGFGPVLDCLVAARLLTTGHDETGQDVVDVSHEALIRGWPRLRRWIEADRAGLLTRRRLIDAARLWDSLDRQPAALYRSALLATAREWAADHPEHLSELVRDFLSVSQAAERNELEAAKRTTHRLRVLASGLAALTAIASVLTVVALSQRSDARRKTTDVTSLALASSASPLLNSRPDVSLLLALEGYRASPRAEARGSMLTALGAVHRAGGVLGILHGHRGPLYGVAFSPDGSSLASAGEDQTIRLWDTRTRKQLGSALRGHTGPIFAVAFSPDGRTLASAGYDQTIRLWDTRTRKQIGSALRGHTGVVRGVAFNPDGRMLVSAGEQDRTLRLWDTRTHKQIGSALRGHRDDIYAVAYSPDGRTVASAASDATIRLWDTRTHKQLGSALRGHTHFVFSVAFSPDGHTLASTGGDRRIRLWDTRTRKQLGPALRGHKRFVFSVAFSPDGRVLASASDDRTIRLWDMRTHKQRGGALRGHMGVVKAVTFSPDSRTLASTSDDETVRLWDVRAHRRRGSALRGHTDRVFSAAFSASGRTLASASKDGTVRLWDTRTHKQVAKLRDHTGPVASVAFSQDNRMLASASIDRTIRIWNASTHKHVATLRGHTDGVVSVAFSPDGRMLASSSSDRTIRLWDTRRHKELVSALRGHTGPVHAVAHSPDGRTLASAGADWTIRLWDSRAHKQLGSALRGHTGPVAGVAFSPDGRTLASASNDHTVRLWDTRTRKQLGSALRGHTAVVYSVAFGPDGRTVASASYDRTVRLWDTRAHKQLGPLRGHMGPVFAVAFSPDRRSLASAGDDKTIRMWEKLLWRDVAELQIEVCNLVGSGLSKTEWEQYAPRITYRQSCP